MLALIIAASSMGFGSLLLADGLADARNRHPSVKRHIDRKELAIAAAFMLGGAALVALSYAA